MAPIVSLKQCVSLLWNIHECLLWNLAETCFLSSLQITQLSALNKTGTGLLQRTMSRQRKRAFLSLKAARVGPRARYFTRNSDPTRHFIKLWSLSSLLCSLQFVIQYLNLGRQRKITLDLSLFPSLGDQCSLSSWARELPLLHPPPPLPRSNLADGRE